MFHASITLHREFRSGTKCGDRSEKPPTGPGGCQTVLFVQLVMVWSALIDQSTITFCFKTKNLNYLPLNS